MFTQWRRGWCWRWPERFRLPFNELHELLFELGDVPGYWSEAIQSDVSVLGGSIPRAMGDVNGDGAPELLGLWAWTDTSGTEPVSRGTWTLMCSPFGDPIDLRTGVLLRDFHGPTFLGMESADIDGDGLADLVDDELWYEPFALSIWYGKDLAAACRAAKKTKETP